MTHGSAVHPAGCTYACVGVADNDVCPSGGPWTWFGIGAGGVEELVAAAVAVAVAVAQREPESVS